MELSTELQNLNAMVEAEQKNVDDDMQEYLAFSIGGEEYGVDILRVQEIKSWASVTPIPNTPNYLCGVLNLRGAIIPIVDLRLRFGMAKKQVSPTTVVIFLKVEDQQTETVKTVGIVVDAVSDAYNINLGDIKPSPDFGEQVNTTYILGLVAIADKMMMVLDIDLLLSAEALA